MNTAPALPTPEILRSARFERIDAMDFWLPSAFTRDHGRKWSLMTVIFYGFLIASMLLFLMEILNPKYSTGEYFVQFLLVFPVSFAGLLPLRELLRFPIYRRLGSGAEPHFFANWRRFAFTTIADGCVLDARGISWLAMMPILVFGTLLVVLLLIFPGQRLFISGLLFFVISTGNADTAQLNFLSKNRAREIYRLDDLQTHSAIFYARKQA